MIIECPECRARYQVPDGTVGATGRTVRCANCRHSWYQEPRDEPLVDEFEEEEEAPAARAPAPAPYSPEPAAAPVPRVPEPIATTPPAPAPEPPPLIAPALVEADPEPSAVAAGYDAFAHRPPFRPERNTARMRTIASLAAGLLMLAAVAVILWTTAPGLAQQVGLSIGPAELPLRIVDHPIERRKMANGSELFAVSGQITNPSPTRQRVPDIRADLRDAQGKIVFSWTITPQQRTLLPNGALDFNSAQVDVPATSKRLDLSFVGEES
ncbi:zinc-ribbon domain-containing protein [Sphingomonas yunnanensis]|uniref:zinc-ribbon domain-containing protein n=1 Tax=Sphingomonas yunnanensis TaxID=310400 RepID=UPI001CA77199|nr:zinc-ribbon domain-containing protein [Sphingomonas yunnanensis]MBY9065024.1 zinc-ribbon domain-containing protein [Sphingomonas yunnanensis]